MSKRLFKILEIIGILIIVFISFNIFNHVKGLLSILLGVLIPFIVGFAIAFILEPFIKFLEKKKVSRKFAVAIISVVFIVIIFIFVKYIGPIFSKQLSNLIEKLPSYIEEFEKILNNLGTKIENITGNFSFNFDNIEKFLNEKMQNFMLNIGQFIQKSFSYLIQIFITPVIAVYFMLYYENIESGIKEYLTKKEKNKTYETLKLIKEALRNYIKGVIIVMLILTVVMWICLMVIKIEYAFLFAIIIGITDIIPYIGPYIGGAVLVLFTIIVHPTKTLIVLVIIVVLQFLESNFLIPKVQSKTMQTNPIIVLLSITFFGEFFGIMGMIIAVPLIKICEIIVKMNFMKKN